MAVLKPFKEVCNQFCNKWGATAFWGTSIILPLIAASRKLQVAVTHRASHAKIGQMYVEK